MKKVVITGGLGFLGTNLTNFLLARNYKVVVVDFADLFGRAKFLDKRYKENYEIIFTDLLNSNLIDILPKDIDYVINLAALPHVDYSNHYPDKTICNNLFLLKRILDYAININAEVIFTSSVEVYGGKENKNYDETDNMNPVSIYGYSKQIGENLMDYYKFNYNLSCTIVRLTNLFGPLQLPDRVIPRNICRLIDNMDLDLTSNFYRDFLYVEEACEIISILMEKEKVGEIYNISDGRSYSMQDVVCRISNYLPLARIEEFDFADLNDCRGKYLVINNTKIKQFFSPSVSFEKRLATTVKWYQENTEWRAQFKGNYEKVRNDEKFIIDSYGLGNRIHFSLQ